jgi:hypothetical protein
MFFYRVEGEETPDPLLQNKILSDLGHLVISIYFDP